MSAAMPGATVRDAAEQLEASFLAEMLKSAGFGAQGHSLGGGIGEEQFASFHRDMLAREMVRAGGIGLADIFAAKLMEGTRND
ncbi:rod-binding protein [Roseovarius sp. MBR-154]|jgi:Rod binding domain-containing protein